IDQGDFAFLGKHEQKILVGQEQDLAVAVTPRPPFSAAVLEAHAGEEVAVEAVDVAPMHDEIVVVRLDGPGGPHFLCRPVGAVAHYTHAPGSETEAGTEQNI